MFASLSGIHATFLTSFGSIFFLDFFFAFSAAATSSALTCLWAAVDSVLKHQVVESVSIKA